MSMGKDRLRSVGVSKLQSSPPRPVLTTARVGIYGNTHTIYIRPYGIRDTTLILWSVTLPLAHFQTSKTPACPPVSIL